MKQEKRLLELLLELMDERDAVLARIEELPCGYISVKQISGHTYYYRQWREGNKIISEYIPETFLNTVKRKIATRKEQENILRAVKADIRKTNRKVSKDKMLTREEVEALLNK